MLNYGHEKNGTILTKKIMELSTVPIRISTKLWKQIP